MEKAPERRPAIPARSMKSASTCAPAKPMTSEVLETRPSLTPKMAGAEGAAAAGPVPALALGDELARLLAGALEAGHRQAVLTFVGGEGLSRLVLRHVGAVSAGFERADDRQHRTHAEEACAARPRRRIFRLGPCSRGSTPASRSCSRQTLACRSSTAESSRKMRRRSGSFSASCEHLVDGDAVDLVVEIGLEAADLVAGGGWVWWEWSHGQYIERRVLPMEVECQPRTVMLPLVMPPFVWAG